MITLKQLSRNRWAMLGAVLALAIYHVLIFRPLSQRVETLDKPLNDVWQELVDFSMESSSVRDLDLSQIKKNQEILRASLAATEKVREDITTRVELEPEVRAKMNEPFFLIDFQNERQKRIEQLMALAKTRQVTLDAAALDGFPEYKAETKDPSLLWAQLSIIHHALTVAINSKVSQINNVTCLPTRPEGGTGADVFWQEIPIRIELVSPMSSTSKFLSALPFRAEEIKAAALPESLPDKPALFIERVLLRKQTPEKPDEINLDLVISGFVLGPKGKLMASQKKEALQ